jgi:WD40 repeat protein
VLPLLSHALAETWRRREGPVLTLAGYRAAGGLSGAVARSAERLFQSLDTREKEFCRGLLLRLVSLTSSRMTVQHPLPLLAFAGDSAHERLIGRLTRARLLSVESDTVCLTHESIARAWPRLREWLEEDADGKRALDHLAGAANAWDESGRSDDELYRGVRLGTVLEWQRTATPQLTPREAEFLGASVRRQANESAQRDAAVRREARQNVILRRLLAVGAGLLATALVAGMLAVLGGIEAGRRSDESRRAEAEAQLSALVSSSASLRSSARDVAALLAIEAYHRWPTDPRTRSALLGSFTAAPAFLGYTRVNGTGSLRGGILPDDTRAVVALESGAVALLDLETGTVLQRYNPPSGTLTPISAMAITRDGGHAVVTRPATESRCGATAHGCSEVAIFDVAAGAWQATSWVVAAVADSLAVDATGETGALVDASTGRVMVVRMSEGGRVTTIDPMAGAGPTRGSPVTVAFLPHGVLAIGSAAGVQLVDYSSGSATRQVPTPVLTANQALVDAGDGVLVASGDQGMVAIDAIAASVRWSVGFNSPHPVPCPRLAASVLSETAYCGDFYGGIEERTLSDGSLTGERFDPQLGDVGELAVSRDGNTLVSIGAEEPVISRWRLDGGGLVVKSVAAGQVVFDSYEPAGGPFVTATRHSTATLDVDFNDFAVWDANMDTPVQRIGEPVQGFGWAGRGLLVGYFESDGTIGFYDLAAGRRVPGVAIPLEAYHLWPAASGTRLYAGFEDGTLWTIDTVTRQRIAPTLHVDGAPTSVSTNADGSVVLVSSEGADGATMSLINGRTGAVIVPPVSGPRMSVLAPDGSVFGARGGHITRYDARLRPIGSIAGARGDLASLQLSDDGAVLLAGANDQTVSVFDSKSGVRLGDPLTSFAPFIGPGFLRPDGLAAAVTGRHGVIVWDLDPTHLAKAACVLAGRNLTAAEWSSHLSALGPWRPTCAQFGR